MQERTASSTESNREIGFEQQNLIARFNFFFFLNSLLTWLTSVYTGFLVSPLQIVTFQISVVFDLITEAHYTKYIIHNT